MHEYAQGIWPIDPEALQARTQLGSFPTIAAGLSTAVLLGQYVGPAEQHANAALAWVLAALCLAPYTVLALSKKVDYLLQPRGTWLRIIDFLTWPSLVFLLASTTHSNAPAMLVVPIAWSVVWPTWHPRNLLAATYLIWGMPLLRWWLVPGASLRSLAVLAGAGLVAFALYALSANKLDRYRIVRNTLKRQQLAIEAATHAQRTAKLAMSVHDGLSGLVAVAEAGLASAPQSSCAESTVLLLKQRLSALIGHAATSSTTNQLAALQQTSKAGGLEFMLKASHMQAWDAIAAEDLLEIVTELVANHLRHGAPARAGKLRKSGSVAVTHDSALIELESQLAAPTLARLVSFQSPQRGLRNVANRIAAYGGTLKIDTEGGTFRVFARIPNRRVAFAPPLLRTALPSYALVFAAGFALMYWAHWYFVWVHLVWYAVVASAHLVQIEILSRRTRQAAEVAEAALLNSHSEVDRELVRARLSPFEAQLSAADPQALMQSLTAFRIELHALLFALEWQGTGRELALQLGLTGEAAANATRLEAVPRPRVVEWVLQARAAAALPP
jgi:hypothetical protein